MTEIIRLQQVHLDLLNQCLPAHGGRIVDTAGDGAFLAFPAADVAATTRQCLELAQAGSELLRVTVNVPEAAAAVPEIRRRLDAAGCDAPLIGDFHYNGHTLPRRRPSGPRRQFRSGRPRARPGSGPHGASRVRAASLKRIAPAPGCPVCAPFYG